MDLDELLNRGGGEKPDRIDALLSRAAPAKPAGGPFPWETEAPPAEDRIGRANRAYAAATEGRTPTALAPDPSAPLPPTGVVDNIREMGGNFARGAKTLGSTFLHPEQLADPSFRREIERGLSDTITFGVAERLAADAEKLTGGTAFTPEQAQADAQAAPGARAAGGIAGSFVPSPGRFIAGKVGAAVPGSGVLPGAVRSVAQYEATAPLAAAIQAPEGQSLDAAINAATDPAGLAVAGGFGAIGGGLSRAPERVRERGVASVARGEAGGTANKRVARKATAKAGEGGEELYAQIGGDLPLEAAVSVFGKSHPGAVAKTFTRRLDRLAEQTEPFYRAIDDAPDPRFANPAKAPKNGGVDLGLVEKRLEASKSSALADGRAMVAEAYDKALARLRAQYGTDGVIVQGQKLPSRAMRNYANELGDGLFTGEVDPALRIRAKQAIYRDVVGAIEDEGERVGLDMSKLRALNKKISTFAATRDAYADRALRAAEGHSTLYNNLFSAGLITSGAGAGGIEGALLGAAADATRRAAMPVVRGADFALAKLVQASRAGAKPAQLGQMALQLGISREVADRIGRDGVGVLRGLGDRVMHGPRGERGQEEATLP